MATRPAWQPTPPFRATLLAAAVALLTAGGTAWGQFGAEPKTENPVFVDEAPAAAEALARAAEHVAAANLAQAAQTIQKLLDDHADQFAVSAHDPNLFEPARRRAHAILRASPALLVSYREIAGPSARQLLDAGRIDEVVRTRFMTHEGLTAALRLARQRVLDGQFDSAAMTVLELVDHPDRAAEGARVAEIAALVARYQTRGVVRFRLGALLGEAPMPPPEPPALADASPPPSMGSGSRAGLVEDLVNQPLGTGVFGDASLPIQPLRNYGDEASLSLLPPYAREMRYWPEVGERAVYFSNGQTVTALDRVSMRRLWSVDAADAMNLGADEQDRTTSGLRRPSQNTWEEVVQPVLTAGRSMLVAVVGRDFDSVTTSEGAEHIVGFDAATGAVRYTVPLRSLDRQLADCYARGPLVSDGRVVVVTLFKRQNQRRLVASVMAGVEATTGRLLWTRVVGSAGVLPFYRVAALNDNTVAGNGVVYRFDRLGVVGAYTIAQGRPLWVRRLSSKLMLDQQQEPEPWLVHGPLVTEFGLFLLSPDHDEVLVLDPETGTVTARRSAADLGEPEYLVATPTHLVAVGKTQLSTVRLDQLDTGAPKRSARIGGKTGIRGRVTVAASSVLVPTASGITVIDPEDPARAFRTVALDAPGSPLSLPEGLFVVDDARAHMYCTWAVAAAHLKAQAAAAPTDAGPATELLVQAERADKPAEMLPAADTALAALARPAAPDERAPQRAAEHRASIVATLLRAVNRSIGQPVDVAGASLDEQAVDGALERAASAARSPGDRVAVLLTQGDVLESRGRWAGAVAAYQSVLLDETLGSAAAPGSRGGMTA
ncbi:MAG: PQQ-binding-like beta-propeller repeat protein, partial [Phycisphaerales bacterium]|nr:PQQ-binding-like beta-propeller repeat protein [Phycisphaerales bacterium]